MDLVIRVKEIKGHCPVYEINIRKMLEKRPSNYHAISLISRSIELYFSLGNVTGYQNLQVLSAHGC